MAAPRNLRPISGLPVHRGRVVTAGVDALRSESVGDRVPSTAERFGFDKHGEVFVRATVTGRHLLEAEARDRSEQAAVMARHRVAPLDPLFEVIERRQRQDCVQLGEACVEAREARVVVTGVAVVASSEEGLRQGCLARVYRAGELEPQRTWRHWFWRDATLGSDIKSACWLVRRQRLSEPRSVRADGPLSQCSGRGPSRRPRQSRWRRCRPAENSCRRRTLVGGSQ